MPPLSANESRALVNDILREARVPPSSPQIVVKRADGNPLFLEELAYTLLERGPDSGASLIPETLQATLLARITHQGDQARELMCTASVLGREFPKELLRALWPAPAHLDPLIRTLKAHELLHEWAHEGHSYVSFRHQLLRDVAYETLDPARQALLNGQAAEALEAMYADRLADAYDQIAHHYARSHFADRAVRYKSLAADAAIRAYSLEEALTMIQEAAAQLDRLPAGPDRDREAVRLAQQQAHPLILLGRIVEGLDVLRRHDGIVERLDDPRLAGPHLFWTALCECLVGDLAPARQHARRGLEAAQRAGDTSTTGARSSCWRSTPTGRVTRSKA